MPPKQDKAIIDLVCYSCHRTENFDNAGEAFIAGWDCPEQIVLCPRCSETFSTINWKHLSVVSNFEVVVE